MDDHAYSSNNETSNQVVDALESVDQLEADLDQTKEPMYKLSYVVRVWADGLEELQRRCDAIRDFYDDSNIKLVRPFGDMLGLHGEFIPASRRYEDDYVQYVTSDFIAGLGFGATQELGNTSGFYMGYNSSTGKNVYLNPKLAAQGVSGSVTNALAMSFTGSLGSGKSLAFNLMAYYSVLFGAKVLIIDPKSERGGWKKDLPNIAEKINIVNLTSDDCNKGLLDPFVIMQDINDAKMLAADLLTFLTGIQAQDGEKFPVLWDAIRTVAESDKRGLLCVIDELRKDERRIAQTLADHIDSFANYSIAQLLFSDGTIKQSVSLENQLNVIQVADLVLPDENVPVKEYTMTETLSVAMMIALSTFALSFIKSDNKIFKIVGLDEAWSFLRVAQGKTLANKLIREGRSMNASVVFITQNTNDLSDEKMKNNIGLKFAFRSRDIAEIKNTLEYLGLDKEDEGLQKQLRNLENGQCMHQDLYGRTGIMQVDVMFSWIFHAFDSRPPMEEVEE